MGPLRDHLSRRGLQFVVAEDFITYYSMYGGTTKNHEEADTLIHCITSSGLDEKRIWVYFSGVDVAVLQIAHRNLLSCRNIYFGMNVQNVS